VTVIWLITSGGQWNVTLVMIDQVISRNLMIRKSIMSNATICTNQVNSFSLSSIVEMLSGYGCQKVWLYRTINTQGETLLVLLDEENGIFEEMASRLDAPDMKEWSIQYSDGGYKSRTLPEGAFEIDLSCPDEAAWYMDLL